MSNDAPDAHIQLILDRYSGNTRATLVRTPERVLIERYLSKVMSPEEFEGKVVLELGAGCSHYTPLILGRGCKRYYANELVPDRLDPVRVADPRYVELVGDFRTVDVPEPIDIVFASLVMMFVQPMIEEFVVRIRDLLAPGGIFVAFDANYLSPISVYRRFNEGPKTPSRLFNPWTYAERFRRHGFEVEKLVPFTAALPWTTGNWVLGTNFWIRARKL